MAESILGSLLAVARGGIESRPMLQRLQGRGAQNVERGQLKAIETSNGRNSWSCGQELGGRGQNCLHRKEPTIWPRIDCDPAQGLEGGQNNAIELECMDLGVNPDRVDTLG
jgi:hypothetical protein